MPLIYWFSRRMTLWGSISFNLAVFINIIIAFFYPYVEGTSTGEAASLSQCTDAQPSTPCRGTGVAQGTHGLIDPHAWRCVCAHAV